MRITVLAVGKLKTAGWRTLSSDYTGRIRRQAKFNLVEIRDRDADLESERLIESLEKLSPDQSFILTEEGNGMSSRQLAQTLAEHESRHTVFVIGGPFGMTDALKAKGQKLSLSKMTFPHEMARVILLEQIYRALSILAGSAYHHD